MKITLLCALALIALPLPAAQLYKWVDDKGNVEWRDTPPPPNAKNVEQRNMGGNTIQTSNMPYALQQAVKKNPVTLWAYDCGQPCNEARDLLAKRSIPYTQKDPRTNLEALKKITGGIEVPVLVVGANHQTGFLAADWDAALDAAGYPKSGIPGVKPQIKKDETDAKAAPKPPANK